MAKKKKKKAVKKRRAKFEFIWIDLISSNIYFICCSRKLYIEAIKREFKTLPPKKSDTVNGTVMTYYHGDTPITVIWVKKINDISVIVHECFHATHRVLADRGIGLCDSSEEVYAYLMDYLVTAILKIRRR